MLTRREWIRQAAGVTAVAAMPGLLSGKSAAKTPANDSQHVSGAGSLKAHAAARGLLTGCAVSANLLRDDESFRKLLAEQYSIVVPENCLKWNMLRPTADTYSFADADSLIAFAETHKMKVRGHNFVWHEALPRWFAGNRQQGQCEEISRRPYSHRGGTLQRKNSFLGRRQRSDLDAGRTARWIAQLFPVVRTAGTGISRPRFQNRARSRPHGAADL